MSTGLWIVIVFAVLFVGLVAGMVARDYAHANRGFVLCPRYEKYNAVVAVTEQQHTALCTQIDGKWLLFTRTSTEEAYAPAQYSGPIGFKPYYELPLHILTDLATNTKKMKIEVWPTDNQGIAVLVVE